jgi:ubiquinone/menaquinone biosynthesis C-methylase UbiE
MVSAKNAGTMTKEEQAEMQAAVRRFSIGGIPQKFEWSVELMGNVFTPECTVLDVAAGEGGLAMLFADKVKEVTCLDCEESAIAAAREACKEAQNISFKQVSVRISVHRSFSVMRH